jgi:hypothetical protein
MIFLRVVIQFEREWSKILTETRAQEVAICSEIEAKRIVKVRQIG